MPLPTPHRHTHVKLINHDRAKYTQVQSQVPDEATLPNETLHAASDLLRWEIVVSDPTCAHEEANPQVFFNVPVFAAGRQNFFQSELLAEGQHMGISLALPKLSSHLNKTLDSVLVEEVLTHERCELCFWGV